MFFRLFKIYALANLIGIPVYFVSWMMAAFSTDSGDASAVTDGLLVAPFILVNVLALLYTLKRKDINASVILKVLYLPILIAGLAAVLFVVIFLVLVGKGVLQFVSGT